MGTILGTTTVFLQQKTDAGLQAVGAASVSHIMGLLSTPFPPASTPGEPPHLRTGRLASGVYYQVNSSEQVTIVSSRVDGDPMVPEWLELGTRVKPPLPKRPYMTPTMDATARICAPAVALAMAADSTLTAAQVASAAAHSRGLQLGLIKKGAEEYRAKHGHKPITWGGA